MEYLRPARFNDALWVSAEVNELRRASLGFDQEIRRSGPEGEKLCEAAIRIVCLTDNDLRPTAIPGFLLERIKDVI